MDDFKNEMTETGIELKPEDWAEFSASISHHKVKKKSVIFRQTETCHEVIYLFQGITASEFSFEGATVITRFFEKGSFCSNIISACTNAIANDSIVAITDVEYYSIPFKLFHSLYLNSDSIGLFIRKKLFKNIMDAKNFISLKTLPETEMKYVFMEENYPEIIRNCPSKYIAAFLGITPEGLSRFKKHRYKG